MKTVLSASLRLVPGAVALVALLLLPGLGSYWTSVGLDFLMWAALVQSWLLFSGLTGYLSLGHAAFFGVGGYVMALLWGKVAIGVAFAAGGFAAFSLAVLVGIPCLRVRGPYFVMLTFGIAEFTKYLTINVEASIDSFGRVLIGAPDVRPLYYVMLGLAILAFALTWWIRGSRWGVGLRAIREDETAAETLGVRVTKQKVLAFAVSAFVPGIVGAVMTLRAGSFDANHGFDPMLSLTLICMAVIGGGDRPTAPLFGVLLLVGLSELLWARFPQLYMVIVGLLLVGFVLLAPGGIAGLAQRWSAKPAIRDTP